MSGLEWEARCDHCGLCCAGCFLYDAEAKRCGDYANRFILQPKCIKLTPENLDTPLVQSVLPASCAYLDESEEPGK